MIRAAFLILAVLYQPAALSSDALSLNPRYNHALFANRERSVDPDASAYGVKFGASEKELLEAFGTPNGVIVINETRKALLYGRSHLFVLKSGKLRELRVSEHNFHWELVKQMDGNPFFDRTDWVLKPGLANGMDFEQVKKLLGRPNAMPDYRFSYDSKQSAVTLNFSSYSSGPGGTPQGYRLHGFSIVNYAP